MRDGPEGTKYEVLPDGACRVVMPDGRAHKAFFDPEKSIEESILEMPGMPNWREPDAPPTSDADAELEGLKVRLAALEGEVASQKSEVATLKAGKVSR